MAYVWQISIVTFDEKTRITGVLLDSNPHKKGKTNVIASILYLIRSYTNKPLSNAEVTIRINNKEYLMATDKNGTFNINLDFSLRDKPDVSVYYQDTELQINQTYPVFFNYSSGKIGVISDIDDTILISHTVHMLKRIGTLALISPQKRKTIQFTEKLINYLNKFHNSIYYLSKSESNLFGILSTFIVHNQLPEGVLVLTPHLSFKQLLTKKKKEDFKVSNIDFIFKNSGDTKFILFGDDTQRDMDIYTTVSKVFPNKVARIYIRQTKKKVSNQKMRKWQKLKESFPASVYFNKNTNIDSELIEINKIIRQ